MSGCRRQTMKDEQLNKIPIDSIRLIVEYVGNKMNIDSRHANKKHFIETYRDAFYDIEDYLSSLEPEGE
jgi:hypothetical protein